ncbi:MAG: methyltransferase domain-containing protein [Chloroflexi bacterium]|nr:methyltransferase domain-containing protein [Chloroflexota bacterium]
MGLDGPRFYDDHDVFTTYQRHRSRDESPNDTLEKPDLLDLIGEAAGRRVIDLGCGDAQIGRELLDAGAAAYLGVEPSENMLRLAREALAGTSGRVVAATIEDWVAPPASADLVISRLALHYVDDIGETFRRVFAGLAAGGRFVFSVEHPVITSCNRAYEHGGQRQEWIVDDYHVSGRRVTRWLGGDVVKYHRGIAEYFGALQEAGFVVEALREARPQRANFLREETYQRRLRIPLMLLLAGRKPG